MRLTYELTDKNTGVCHPFSETFVFVRGNERTQDFLDYLDAVGIGWDEEGLPCFVGCTEKVVIKRNPTRHGTLPSIVERDFLSRPGDTK